MPQRLLGETRVNGIRGSLWEVYFTDVEPFHQLGACMWVNRDGYPGQPPFNPVPSPLGDPPALPGWQ
jgi:hypothetical protein